MVTGGVAAILAILLYHHRPSLLLSKMAQDRRLGRGEKLDLLLGVVVMLWLLVWFGAVAFLLAGEALIGLVGLVKFLGGRIAAT
jgi:hypothetical protein